MIEVLKKGLFTSVQDLGRRDGLVYGVPLSGAMDRSSLIRVNMVLDNDPAAAAIECTLIGPELRFQENAIIAISGADMSPMLNGKPIPMLRTQSVNTGDILKLGPARRGCRSYIGVKGGLISESVMGSKSQYKGVTSSSHLDNGSRIKIKTDPSELQLTKSRIKPDFEKFESLAIKVMEGPEFKALGNDQVHMLNSKMFTVSSLNNRMAYQLKELIPNEIKPIITGPVLPGTVQLTPSGQLIILMRDAQTTGGYPRILQLADHAIDCLAQKQAGEKIGFKF